ncbi:glycosyltransferase [Micromonospora sp. DR5-3]|uniref:glycosyltransferase n=1 Tax=unclassified Micromonospora TaxID=2617518 RepID=UPI0011DADA55|nr:MULTISPECIES: glycosyltransferase [unclassified Micromonospora]MCW3818994.1 glycosyltransferase [Micromonospora sp. DR5-3]TYC21007.1 glycosyltransferase [Micromonospora sp. MP36]
METGGVTGQTPFLRVTDPRGRPLRWVLVRAPVVRRIDAARLADLADQGCRFAGMTSYLGFPGAGHRDERDYGAFCEAWFHCFREPDRHLPPVGPRALLSESDFVDPRVVDPGRLAGEPLPPELTADVVYVCGAQPWKQEAKQWPLARRCLAALAAEGLRVLVVDAPHDLAPPPGVRLTGPLPWQRLLAVTAQARYVLVPGILDPSPRVLAEALCLDVPVLVNRHILGGWKYVTPFTGAFFDDERDVVAAAAALRSRRPRPRSWFMARYGPAHAGRALLDLLRSLDPDLPPLTHALLVPDEAVG